MQNQVIVFENKVFCWHIGTNFGLFKGFLEYASFLYPFHQTGIQIYIAWVYISLDTAFSAI
jgi:hypothetical protein